MRIIRKPLLLFLFLSMTGCASVSMVGSMKEPSAPTKSYRNFLVVGITQDRQMRQVFEEILAAGLQKKGVSATPCYTITGVGEKQTREMLEKAVQTTTVDAVITTRVVDWNQKTGAHVEYNITSSSTGYINPYFDDYAVMPYDMYGYYGVVNVSTMDSQRVQTTLSTTTLLETNLFDVATKKLVWSGTVKATNPQGIIKVSEEFAAVVIGAMSRQGLLPSSNQ
jgi:hypothetical protein